MQALNQLELFFGDAHEAAARVYARLARDESTADRKLSGELVGPECRFAQTLSARIPFRDLGPGESLLAEAVVPDPCFWTPELPMLYRAELGARDEGRGPRGNELVVRSEESVEQAATPVPLSPCGRGVRGEGEPSEGQSNSIRRWFGIRRLGTKGRAIFLDMVRWVPRGVWLPQITVDDLKAARKANITLCGPPPDDGICLEASKHGVPLFIDLNSHAENLLEEVRRLGQWPAIFLLIFPADAEVDSAIRAAAKNVLFAAKFSAGAARVAPPWAQVLLCDVDAEHLPPSTGCQLPVLIRRRISSAAAQLAAARAACDRLQYDMAASGDFAGYFVT
ncbi:MAG TPA: hypothetical protein VHX65_12905 [Pirellulales bacterium]|nr:hypothetical protein [Pirellulales bacterium]